LGIPLAAGTLSAIIGDKAGLSGISRAGLMAGMHQDGAKTSHVAEAVHITDAVVGTFSVALMFRGLRRLRVMLGMGGMVHGHVGMAIPVVMRRHGLNGHEANQGAKGKGDQNFFRLGKVRHF
jgi:hypothetical protein